MCHSDTLTDLMLQVINIYICVSKQATVASTCHFDVCAIIKSFAGSGKKVVAFVVTKEVDEHALQHLRTVPVTLDVGSGSSEGPNTSEYMNTTALGL